MYQKEIKQSNENIVFHSIYFTENSFSIPDLTKITNMTFPTIKRVINEFLEKDIIKEWTLSTGGVGRRAVRYKYNPDFCYSIGVSVDEEKIKLYLAKWIFVPFAMYGRIAHYSDKCSCLGVCTW